MKHRWHNLLAVLLVGCSWQARAGLATAPLSQRPPPAAVAAPTVRAVIAGVGRVSTTQPAKPTDTAVMVLPVPTSSVTAAARTSIAPDVAEVAVPPAVEVLPTPTLGVLGPAQRIKLFDAVWQTVADHYLYRDFHGVNWQARGHQYRVRAAAAMTPADFYAIIGSMIDELHDDHSRFISPQTVVEERHVADGSEAYVGVGVALDTDNTIVTTVFPSSPAAQAGLRRRDRIILIDGKPASQAIDGLRGPEGSTVRLRVKSPGAAARDVVVSRHTVNARLVPDAYRLPNTKVGYVLIQSLWSEAMDHDVEVALEALVAGGPLQGLILDLRGNGGGWRSVLLGILQNFERGRIGSFANREHDYPIDISPDELYGALEHLPIVVLVDHQTESYAEVLAASLQASGRAKVIGTQTAGNTETIYAYDFSDGSRLWLAQEAFKLPDGRNLEGQGLRPDVIVDVPWEQYSEANDPQIKRALRALGLGT